MRKMILCFIIGMTILVAKQPVVFLDMDLIQSKSIVQNEFKKITNCQVKAASVYQGIMLCNKYGDVLLTSYGDLKSRYPRMTDNMIRIKTPLYKGAVAVFVYIHKQKITLIKKVKEYLQ